MSGHSPHPKSAEKKRGSKDGKALATKEKYPFQV
jgi:hypothetical protein